MCCDVGVCPFDKHATCPQVDYSWRGEVGVCFNHPILVSNTISLSTEKDDTLKETHSTVGSLLLSSETCSYAVAVSKTRDEKIGGHFAMRRSILFSLAFGGLIQLSENS